MPYNSSPSLQFWGAGSGLTQVGSMIDALLYQDTVKINELQQKKNDNQKLSSTWDKFNNNFNSLKNILNDLKRLYNNKKVTLSSNDYFSFSVNGNVANSNYNIKIEQLATAHKIYSNQINGTINKNGTITINDAEINVEENDTLNSLIEKINKSNANVKAYSIDNRLVIENNQTGKDNLIQVNDNDGILKDIGLIKETNELNTLTEPQNAIFYINDIKIERNSNEINDAIPNTTIKLYNITNNNISVKIENDNEALINKIKDLVNIINTINKDISNETSKGSKMQGNTLLNNLKSNLVSKLQSSYNGTFLFNLGISIDKYGTFNLNETKLKEYIQNNDVKNFLTGENGFIATLENFINNNVLGTKGLINTAKEKINNENNYIDKVIKKQQESIERKRAMLTKQFSNMEKIISQLKGTQNYLQSAFNNNNNNK